MAGMAVFYVAGYLIINIGQLIQSVLTQSVYIIFYFILFRILVIIYAFNNLFLHCILYRHTYIIYIYTVYILYTIIHIYFMIF